VYGLVQIVIARCLLRVGQDQVMVCLGQAKVALDRTMDVIEEYLVLKRK
jgi:hypothetical protein